MRKTIDGVGAGNIRSRKHSHKIALSTVGAGTVDQVT